MLGSLLCLAAATTTVPAQPVPFPRNVLIIVLDDIGVDRVAVYGANPDAGPTPVLDTLADTGLLFSNAYSDPVCSPTRATILTGLYGHDSGLGNSVPWSNPTSPNGQYTPTATMLPALLDVRSAAIGKWHLDRIDENGWDAAVDRGFELYRGYPGGQFTPPVSYTNYDRAVADASGSTVTPETTYATTQEVDDALEVIESFGAEPWFVWLALHAPHWPFEPPPDHLHSFGDLTGADDKIIYRAMIEAADAEIGRLLASIRPATLDRTTVFVLGDNGTPGPVTTPPSDPNRSKGKVYEGGINVPFIAWGAGIQRPGREVDALVNTVDLFQTVLDLFGAGDGGRPDSISLTRYMRLPFATPAREWVYARRHRPNGFGPYDDGWERDMVRDERFKLIRRAPIPPATEPTYQFYDLVLDPLELTDLQFGGLNPFQQERFDALVALIEDITGS